MKEFFVLISPMFWSVKNDIVRFNRSFYKKLFLYVFSGILFIFLFIKLLNLGMIKLQNLSPEVFNILLTKGYSLIFIIIFFLLIISGFIMSLNKFYQSRDLELIFASPVSRTSLFFSRLIETHVKTSWMLIIFSIPLIVSLGNIFQANLLFYFYSLILLMVFSIIPVNIGIGTTILLSGIFHIKKIRKFIFSVGFVTVIILVTLLRLSKPERFVNPEFFANLKIFLSELKAPFFILLPNRWFSESLFLFLNKNYNDTYTLLFIPLLFLTAYITIVSTLFLCKKYHYKGWSLLQGGEISVTRKSNVLSSMSSFIGRDIFSKILKPLLLSDSQCISLFRKDLLYQFHDIKNIQQNLVLLSLVIVYLFSISSLPVNWLGYGIQLKYYISFFNIGLILIILASLCSKLVYPALVTEGKYLWILKTAPITSRKFIWTKFIFLFIPIFVLGQLLTVFSSVFVYIERDVFILNLITIFLVSFSLVSMAIFFSIVDLRKAMKGNADEEITTGNTIYMILSVFFILFILALEIIPLYLYFLKESVRVEFTHGAWLIIGSLLIVLIVVNFLASALSLRVSIRKFDTIYLE
jgi:ABC-2 type transport system permease protein